MNFGDALEALKIGHQICRSGWNGKNMYLLLQKGVVACEHVELSDEDMAATMVDKESAISDIDGVSISLFTAANETTNVDVMPHIYMITATGKVVNGWLASQTDMLAGDWEIKN